MRFEVKLLLEDSDCDNLEHMLENVENALMDYEIYMVPGECTATIVYPTEAPPEPTF